MQDFTGRTLLDRYRVVRFIGRGGMAMVYEAWDEKRAATVAIKLMHEDMAEDTVFLRRFATEAQTLARLDHPHIVRFLGFEEGRGQAFMVMEYVSGVPLRRQLHLLARPLTLPEALGVLQPVCGALHYAHQFGIYHCDIKPANIFIDQGGKVILGDFGIARLSESATMTFSTPGTPAYMSPEQCLGGQRLDSRTDIYSLGITTYELLSLDRPFKGDTTYTEGSRVERVRWEQINAQPPSLREVNAAISPQVESVIMRALEKDPRRRYQAAIEFYDALQGAAAMQAAAMAPLVDQYDETVLEQAAPTPFSSSGATPAIPPTAGTSGISQVATAIDAPVPAATPAVPKRGINKALLFGGIAGVAILIVALAFMFGGGTNFLNRGTLAKDGQAAVFVPDISPTPPPTATGTATPPPTDEPAATVPVILPTEPPPTEPPPTPTPSPTPSNVFVLYALNASNGMLNNGEMAIVEQGLAAHLQALEPAINAGLLAFGHQHTGFEEEGCSIANVELRVPMRPNNAATIWESVTLLNPIGIAPVADALVDAHNYFTYGEERSNALIVLTDGESLCDEAEDVWRRVRTRQVDSGQALPVHVVGIKLNDSEALLYQTLVTDAVDGSFQNVTDATGLTEALDRIVAQVANE